MKFAMTSNIGKTHDVPSSIHLHQQLDVYLPLCGRKREREREIRTSPFLFSSRNKAHNHKRTKSTYFFKRIFLLIQMKFLLLPYPILLMPEGRIEKESGSRARSVNVFRGKETVDNIDRRRRTRWKLNRYRTTPVLYQQFESPGTRVRKEGRNGITSCSLDSKLPSFPPSSLMMSEPDPNKNDGLVLWVEQGWIESKI